MKTKVGLTLFSLVTRRMTPTPNKFGQNWIIWIWSRRHSQSWSKSPFPFRLLSKKGMTLFCSFVDWIDYKWKSSNSYKVVSCELSLWYFYYRLFFIYLFTQPFFLSLNSQFITKTSKRFDYERATADLMGLNEN